MKRSSSYQSANGAKYESQGQARSEASASPLVNTHNDGGLKGRNRYPPYSALFRARLHLL